MFQLILGFFLTFLGTVIGSAFVYFLKGNLNEKVEQILIGLAGGMMMSASIWSLLVPALEQKESFPNCAWLPAIIGFALGIIFLLVVEVLTSKLENTNRQHKFKGQKTGNMLLAVIIHNIPEGMAVGVALAGAYYGNALLSMEGALTLAIGIAIQNVPDGAIVSLPLYTDGHSKNISFLLGVLSGLLELVCAVIAFFLTEVLTVVLPYILSFAGGATIFVIVKDLIPSSQTGKHTNLATIAFAVGFIIMMILDVAIG